MKIQVKDKSQNGVILVRRISWKQRCEEQVAKINEQIKQIIKDLEGVVYG